MGDATFRRVCVAGYRGMLGSALVRRLAQEDCRLLPLGREILDLRDQAAVFAWFDEYRPDAVFLAAATVGGIYANDRQPADFLYDNLAIAANVIEAARRSEVRKLVFFGTSCMYPKLAAQPISEDSLLEGPLEPTNEWYGVAKIAGVKLCQAYRRQHGCDFVTVVPTNLYGPGDNFDPLQSHVIPALMRKLHNAVKEGDETVEIWGTGKPRREFMHVDDAADAAVFLLRHWSAESPINVGSGEDIGIAELAETIARVVGFQGRFAFDLSKPDGAPRKALDASKLLALGWRAQIGFDQGIRETYDWFVRRSTSPASDFQKTTASTKHACNEAPSRALPR
jgi:GDP-L-fucose synthase